MNLIKTLSPRQLEVVQHIAVGRTYDEIAEAMGILRKTVHTMRRQAMDKLGARNDVEVALAVIKHSKEIGK